MIVVSRIFLKSRIYHGKFATRSKCREPSTVPAFDRWLHELLEIAGNILVALA